MPYFYVYFDAIFAHKTCVIPRETNRDNVLKSEIPENSLFQNSDCKTDFSLCFNEEFFHFYDLLKHAKIL